MRPDPCFLIAAAALRIVNRTPFRLTPSTLSQSEPSIVSIRCPPSTANPGRRRDAGVRKHDVDAALGGHDVVDQGLHLPGVRDVDGR